MNGRITSPEQLNEQMKVSPLRVWVILVLLTALVGGGLAWFLSQKIVVEETYPCYATGTVAPIDETYYGLLLQSFGDGMPFDIETVREDYGERVEGDCQLCYLAIPDYDSSEVVDGMRASFGGVEGTVAIMPYRKSPYADLEALGFTNEEMQSVGMNPGVPYYLCPVLVRTADGNTAVEPGFYLATISIDILDPVSFIIKS